MLGVAGWVTPVPGGVGPMTVAMLMKNTLQCARRLAEREVSREREMIGTDSFLTRSKLGVQHFILLQVSHLPHWSTTTIGLAQVGNTHRLIQDAYALSLYDKGRSSQGGSSPL